MIALPILVLPMYLMFGRRSCRGRTLPRSAVRILAGHWRRISLKALDLPGASPGGHQHASRTGAIQPTHYSPSCRARFPDWTSAPYSRRRRVRPRGDASAWVERARCGVDVRFFSTASVRSSCLGSASRVWSWAASRPRFSAPARGAGPRARATCAIIVKWSSADGAAPVAGGRNLAANISSVQPAPPRARPDL